MTNEPTSKPTAATRVFVLGEGSRFVCLAELATGRQFAYAFTSQAKAKDFLRVLREAGHSVKVDRLLPCTLDEWSDWQTKKSLPDLTIDADPHAIANYPMHVSFDPEQQNLRCVTTKQPGGTVYRVDITPRDNPAAD
jgi:hypothetical protein